MAKKRSLNISKSVFYIINILFSLSIGVFIGTTIPSTFQNDKTNKTEEKPIASNASILRHFPNGKEILNENILKSDKQKLYLVYAKNPDDPSSEQAKVHLLDLELCAYPEVMLYFQETPKVESVLLNSGGCGDGQKYYLISLIEPYKVQEVSLPYSFIDKYGSEPIAWLNKDTILFKKVTITSSGNSYTEFYTSNLNDPKVYKKVNFPN